MKKLILSTLLTLFSFSCFSQSLISSGAEWYYDYTGYSTNGYIYYQYTDDTFIIDSSVVQLDRYFEFFNYENEEYYSGDLDPIYLYSNENQVYSFVDGEFVLLYDLNASIGDPLINRVTGDCSIAPEGLSIVDSVGTVEIGSETLRYLYLADTDGLGGVYNGYVYEKIGCVNMGFPVDYTFCDANQTFQLRCYSDDNFSYSNPNYFDNCDFIIGIEELSSSNFRIYPNPSVEVFQIQIQDVRLSKIRVYNSVGVSVLNLNGDDTNIDLSGYPTGLYYVTMTSLDGRRFSEKIVKSDP